MRDIDISYLRVSTARQRDEGTIETQRYALDRYFEQHAIRVDPEFCFEDDGVSGGIEIHKRAGGGEVFRLIGQGRVRRLFLFHSDRVGRDTIDTLLFHRLAENHGTQIIGIADGTDTFREGSTLETEIKAVIAAEYRRDRVRRTKAGLRRRAAAGKVSTHAPFGYDLEDGNLVLSEEKAEVMAHNFAEVARGTRTRDIVARLNESRAPSPRGTGWRHDTFIYLLKNPVYMGEFLCFRTPKKRPGGGKRIPRDPNEQVVIPCPAIVSRELFEAVQARLAFNRQWCATSGKHFYMLKSLIRCGQCGRAYVGHTISGRRYKERTYSDVRYYECGTLTNRDYEFCRNVRVNADRLENAIWEEIKTFMRSPSKIIEQLVARYSRHAESNERTVVRRRKRIEHLKVKNLEARKCLALAIARGIITDEEAQLARDALAKELTELERERADFDRTTNETESHRKQVVDAQTLLRGLRKQLEQGFAPEKKSEIARRLVRQAVVSRGGDGRPHVAVQYVFPPPVVFSAVGFGFNDSSRKK